MPHQYDDWHWWRASADGRCATLKEFEKLPPSAQGALLEIMKSWREGRTGRKEVNSLGGGIFELRHREGNNHFRVLYYVDGRVGVVLRSFYKNQQKCPPSELETARQRMKTGCHGPA
ncbi:type II toxin-antitoxin system RelE/ParE family toxin [Propioniciclava sinopodophylli]|uniref:type II toxin-antitoxin system RelE/ParE family toxin n=1 Tax=Propioniciclava sinopodophylli TaxID=1837344 RepID=UPI0024903A03|nr:type II toxin-antitoxin system RelE/ParE family toxin [Propioniciclava sinopodophylli]